MKFNDLYSIIYCKIINTKEKKNHYFSVGQTDIFLSNQVAFAFLHFHPDTLHNSFPKLLSTDNIIVGLQILHDL